jgi:hypothetical protein
MSAITDAYVRPAKPAERADRIRSVLSQFAQTEDVLPAKIRRLLQQYDDPVVHAREVTNSSALVSNLEQACGPRPLVEQAAKVITHTYHSETMSAADRARKITYVLSICGAHAESLPEEMQGIVGAYKPPFVATPDSERSSEGRDAE